MKQLVAPFCQSGPVLDRVRRGAVQSSIGDMVLLASGKVLVLGLPICSLTTRPQVAEYS
ncbi:hypothetical protein ACET1L_05745 [Escherichia coli]|uniref:hypothetical protein n=1 Tax=Escherichia coli TaxID=562 RepID=UPI0035A61B4F